MIKFPWSTGWKTTGRQILKCETSIQKRSTLLHKSQKNGSSFHTSNFDNLQFFSQWTQETLLYVFWKPWVVAIEIWCEIGSRSALRSVRSILVKVVLFQLSGRGHPQNDAMPNFFANFKRPILGLSNEVSFVPEVLWKMVRIKETFFLSTRVWY